jgi:uncharacterized membrane protein YgcG
MSTRFTFTFALGWVGVVVLASAAPLRSQSRELHWRSLDVTARLDRDGRLQVRERQAMVFTGDWNGGERIFRLRWDQKLQLLGMEREDPETHSMVALTRGDLDLVDHYDFTDSTTLRWRSRLQEDPPFQETEIVYLLDYRLSNVLIPESGNRYRLDHDFAFPDRAGPIESFSLDLSFDPAWETEPSFTGHETRGTLPPGESVLVTLPLRYRGEGSPAGVRRPAGESTRTLLSALFLAGLLALGAVFYVQERGIGRFAPLTDPGAIDEGWLKENVFSMLPEEVGAAWDDTTSAPEVGAVLARMQSEGKIQSEVYVTRVLFFSEKNLRLKLLKPKAQLSGYERSLADALFFSGSETDTEKIRAHYRSSGFNPASKIEGPLKQRVKALLRGQRRREISKKPTLVLLSLSILSLVFVAVTEPRELAALIAPMGFSAVFYLLVLIPAILYRKRVERLALFSLTFLAPMALLATSALYFLSGDRLGLGTPALLALTFFLLALFTSLFNLAKFRDGDAALRIRKKLASARRYFRQELGSRDPRLQDAWFPYLLAFGLGSDVDRWFRAFGGASTSTSFGSSSTSSLSSTGLGSSSTSGSSWTGGGGAFGGAGATASWAAAVGSVAAGVAAPSSSGSSGGGGGGGGSSGGGGGGGW